MDVSQPDVMTCIEDKNILGQKQFPFYNYRFATRAEHREAESSQEHVPINVGSHCLDMLMLVREENRGTRRKTPEAQKRYKTKRSSTGTQLT